MQNNNFQSRSTQKILDSKRIVYTRNQSHAKSLPCGGWGNNMIQSIRNYTDLTYKELLVNVSSRSLICQIPVLSLRLRRNSFVKVWSSIRLAQHILISWMFLQSSIWDTLLEYIFNTLLHSILSQYHHLRDSATYRFNSVFYLSWSNFTRFDCFYWVSLPFRCCIFFVCPFILR